MSHGFDEALIKIGHTEESLQEIMDAFGEVTQYPRGTPMKLIMSKIQGVGMACNDYLEKGDFICIVVSENGKRYPAARYTNHSSDPNCVFEFAGGHVQALALRNIKMNEEITVDYVNNFNQIRNNK